MLPAERQKACRNLLKDYYSSLCKHLLSDHSKLKAIEKQNRKILQVRTHSDRYPADPCISELNELCSL